MILAIDMGGTHIDGVVIKDQNIIKTIKNKTNKDDLFKTIMKCLNDLLKDIDKSLIKRINLSTTVSTNAIVENKISKVGLVVQTGPGRNYDFANLSKDVIFVSGYTDHKGDIVTPINKAEIKEVVSQFKNNDIESVGIISKFSVRNPSHENDINKIINKTYNNTTVGSSLSGKLNFLRRVNTTYLNAAIKNTFNDFIDNLEKSLKEKNISAPVYILKADGGTMTINQAKVMPVETILSGPAASFMGISSMYDSSEDQIYLDIGGTTCDIFFMLEGDPLFEPKGITINKHKTLIRAIYSYSIGLGGDSFVSIENNKIKIGPQRLDRPIAFGGRYLTPTDAMVALDKIDANYKAETILALKEFGDRLNLSVNEVSELILKEFVSIINKEVKRLLKAINSQPVYTIKKLLSSHKLEPKSINVIGGPAKILSLYLEEEFKLDVSYPKNYKVANAIGAALAKPTFEINMHVDTYKQTLSVPEFKIYDTVSKSYNLDKAKAYAIKLIKEKSLKIGENKADIEAEIVEANSFNMVKGYFGSSKNIRVKAQSKPGLIYKLKGAL